MEITVEQLAAYRAKSMWDEVLDILFTQMGRSAYHQHIETIEPVYFWKGEFILRVPEDQFKHIESAYQSLLLEALKKTSRLVESIKLMKADVDDFLDVDDKEWASDSQFIKEFWEKVLDQFPKQADRSFYQKVTDWVTPLAKVDNVFVINVDRYANLLQNEIETHLLPCIQHVDSSIEELEFVQIQETSRKRKMKKSTVVHQNQTTELKKIDKDFWAAVLAEISPKVSKPSFETWLLPSKFVSFRNGTLTIAAPNNFSRDWVESRYSDVIKETIRKLNPAVKALKITSSEDVKLETTSISSTQLNEIEKSHLEERLDRIERQLSKVLKRLEQR